MILVDKDIKELAEKVISTGYNEENVNAVSYDITLNCVIIDKKEVSSFDLIPGQTVIIRTNEEISVPENLMLRVAEKNSLIRQGLKIDAPHYFPGHRTFMFLRVTNLTENVFTLTKNLNIAQLIFEQLTQKPSVPYNMQKNASFNNETSYLGTGNYSNEYAKLTKKFKDAKEDLETIKEKLYANILTIMGIFVSIFTLVSVNIQAFIGKEITASFIATINLCMITGITVLMGLILLIVHKAKKRWFTILYLIILTVLIVSTFTLTFLK